MAKGNPIPRFWLSVKKKMNQLQFLFNIVVEAELDNNSKKKLKFRNWKQFMQASPTMFASTSA